MKRVTLFWSLLALVAVMVAGCSSTMTSSAPTAAPAATSAAQAAGLKEMSDLDLLPYQYVKLFSA